MNACHFVGNLARDPMMKQTSKEGISRCQFTIAVNRGRKGKDGNRQTDYIPVVAWRVLADNCAKYLKKGSKVAVDGELQSRSYEAENGEKRFVLEIVAGNVEFLPSGSKEKQQEAASEHESAAAQDNAAGFQQIDEDDLPF